MSTLNDGNIPYGVAAITIGSTLFTLDSFDVDRGGSQIERRNGQNVLTGRVHIDDLNITGSATLQRSTITTELPAIGTVFTAPSDAVYTGACVVMGASASQNPSTPHTFTIRWSNKIN